MTELKAGPLEQAVLILMDRVNKLCNQVSASQVKKYGTPRSREFRLPP